MGSHTVRWAAGGSGGGHSLGCRDGRRSGAGCSLSRGERRSASATVRRVYSESDADVRVCYDLATATAYGMCSAH